MSAFISGVGAGNTNGASLTTGAIDTSGANLIVIATSTTFTGGTPTDSKSNTWTQIGTGSATHNTAFNLWYCFNPTTDAAHTFTNPSNGSGFNAGIAVAAFSGCIKPSSTVLDGTSLVAVGDPPTAAQGGSMTPTANNAIWISIAITEQGSGTPTVDSGLTIGATGSSNGQSTQIAYILQGTAGALNPLWTMGSGNLHWGVQNQPFFGSAATTPITENLSDSLSLSDDLRLGYGNILDDSLSLSDSLLIEIPAPSVVQSDAFNFSDRLETGLGLILSEGFTLSDLLAYGLSLPVSVSGDQFNFSDFMDFLIGVGIGQSDTFTFSDVLRIAADVAKSLGDNILLSDFLTVLLLTFPHYTDSFALSDEIQLRLSLELIQTDSLALSDAVQVAIEHTITVLADSDTLALTDSVELSLSDVGNLDSYIRHYLNDVPR